jgi:hypothetical protein
MFWIPFVQKLIVFLKNSPVNKTLGQYKKQDKTAGSALTASDRFGTM